VPALLDKTDLTNRVTSRTFRQSFVRYLLADGYNTRTAEELLGHSDVRASMISRHVFKRGHSA